MRYIASGGDRDFMRPIAGNLYGIPPERVIGSSTAIEYREGDDDSRDVLYKSEMEFFDDGPTKPVRIWSRIGRRPVIAGGNSNGDIAMLALRQVRCSPGTTHRSCCTTTPSASSTTPPAPRRRSSGRASPGGP